MQQMTLPLANPRDRGRLNALRNMLAAISDELRQQAPVAQGMVEFSADGFPRLLQQFSPLMLVAADSTETMPISPYPFEIADLVDMPSAETRPDVFATPAELVRHLNVSELSGPLRGAELIGIDESQVDTPLPQSTLTFLKSIAFRMYARPDGTSDEALGPILSELRMQLREAEAFENENKLLGYIRNHYVAYMSSLTALTAGRKPFVVLHGPLVRAIGGFSSIYFDYKTAHDLLNTPMPDAGEFDVPDSTNAPIVTDDATTATNMSSNPRIAISGDENLQQFNRFCLHTCGRKCADLNVYPREAVPPEQTEVSSEMVKGRHYPGFCLYFWMLRSLLDVTRKSEAHVVSVVDDIAAATEMTRLVLPSILANPVARTQVAESSLRAALDAADVSLPSQVPQRRNLYRQVKRAIDRLNLSDANLFSFVLAEGQFTAPVQIYRYRTQNTFDRVLGDSWIGTRDVFENILKTLFPPEPTGEHPGYRVMMSYLRTTPLREPIRVECFDLPHLSAKSILGPVYLLSLPYQEYGLPIVLYYADKLARTPTKLIRTIIEREYFELVLRQRFSDPVSIMAVLGKLARNYIQREGLK